MTGADVPAAAQEAQAEIENLRHALKEAGKEMDRRYEMGWAAALEWAAQLADKHQAQYPDPGWGIRGSKRLPFASLLRQGGEGGTDGP